MDFVEVLKRGVVSVDLKGERKEEIIGELVALLDEAGLIRDRDAVHQAVMARERSMSTGLQHGVAAPHGKTDTVEDLVTVVALKTSGVDFESIDGEPSRIFVMTVSPVTMVGPHVCFLAQIGRLLESPKLRARLLASENAMEMIEVLSK